MEIKRHNFKWNINEVLKLQREYELLGMSIQDIAKNHSRSRKAILCKLEKEGFIEKWTFARGIEEFIESDSELRKFKSLIFNGYNNNNNNNNNNNCEISSSITSSEIESEIESDDEPDDEPETLYETNNFDVVESINYLNIKNVYVLTMKLMYFIFQLVKNNFTKKIIF